MKGFYMQNHPHASGRSLIYEVRSEGNGYFLSYECVQGLFVDGQIPFIYGGFFCKVDADLLHGMSQLIRDFPTKFLIPVKGNSFFAASDTKKRFYCMAWKHNSRLEENLKDEPKIPTFRNQEGVLS